MRLFILLSFLVSFTLFSCLEKENVTEQTHVNEEIDGNNAPPYHGVTTVQIQNYVNKMYIDLIGREPIQAELQVATNALRGGELSLQARDQLMQDLQSRQDYFNRFWEVYSANMLNGTSQQIVLEKVQEYQFIYQLLLQTDPLGAQFILEELKKLQALQQAPAQYKAGAININTFLARMVSNAFYDEINMGSENFVISCFENLFKRLPTDTELERGVTIVNGFPAQLLLLDGTNKSEFINIVTTVPEFYQGLAIDVYRQLLSRTPTSQEMGEATLELSQNGNYQALQRKVMKTSEYAGF